MRVVLDSHRPVRPSLPVLLLFALLVWAVLAGYFYFFNPQGYRETEIPETPIAAVRSQAVEFYAKNSGSSAGILQALVCGERTQIKEDGTYDDFKICGLAHVVAVSGAHLSIVTGMLIFCLQRMKCGRRVMTTACLLFLLFYLLFTGVPISAIRSAVMVALGLLAGPVGRRADSLNALGIALLVFFSTDPTSATDVSLFLSAMSTLSILLFAQLIMAWFPERLPAVLSGPISLTLAANIATMPYSIGVFSQCSTIAIFSNIIATPLFSLGCVGGLICAALALLLPFAQSIFGFVAMLLALPLRISVEWMAQIPYASLAVAADPVLMVLLLAVLMLALYVTWPAFNARTVVGAVAAITLLLFYIPGAGDGVVMLNVGQGDSILIKSNGRAVLIDTGNKASLLRRGLGLEGIRKLDAVIITHHDDDHMGCLEELASYVQFSTVYVAEDALDCECENCGLLRSETSKAGKEMKGLEVGDSIQIGTYNVKVLWPKSFSDKGGNADSLILLLTEPASSKNSTTFANTVTAATSSAGSTTVGCRLPSLVTAKPRFATSAPFSFCSPPSVAPTLTSAQGVSILLTGDAESDQLEEIVGKVGDIDVLKVGHHGSKVSLSEEILEKLKPEVALISVGANNMYGHPTEECLSLLSSHNIKTFRTDQSGTIRISGGKIYASQ